MRYDLIRLRKELASGGIFIENLGSDGVNVFTYNEEGEPISLPSSASTIVEAHIPPVDAQKIDVGEDVPSDQEQKLAEATRNLRTYLQVTAPNGAQTAAALKIIIRIILFMLKRQGY